MEASIRITRQMETAFQGPAWHGPSLMENVRGISEGAARARPLPGAHSIWEIVNHVMAWQNFAIGILGGNHYATLKGEADWPPVVPDASWEQTVARLESSHAELLEKTEKVSEEHLNGKIPGADYSLKVLLRGIAEHNLYHAGQIGMLRRAAPPE